jgi:hypothetical protein
MQPAEVRVERERGVDRLAAGLCAVPSRERRMNFRYQRSRLLGKRLSREVYEHQRSEHGIVERHTVQYRQRFIDGGRRKVGRFENATRRIEPYGRYGL